MWIHLVGAGIRVSSSLWLPFRHRAQLSGAHKQPVAFRLQPRPRGFTVRSVTVQELVTKVIDNEPLPAVHARSPFGRCMVAGDLVRSAAP